MRVCVRESVRVCEGACVRVGVRESVRVCKGECKCERV